MPTTHQTLLQKSQNKSQQLLAKILDVIGPRWNSNLKSVQKKKPNDAVENVKGKWMNTTGWERKAARKPGRGSPPWRCSLGNGCLHLPVSTVCQGTWGSGAEARCALCVFFHHFFSSVFPLNQSLRVARWQCPLPSFHLACSPDLSLFLRPHGFGSLSSFLRNDYLQTCYVKSYDIAHHPQALSNGPPWKILVNTRQGPSGLMFVLSYYHKMSRKEPPGTLPCGTQEKKRQGEIWMWNSHTFQLLSILRE